MQKVSAYLPLSARSQETFRILSRSGWIARNTPHILTIVHIDYKVAFITWCTDGACISPLEETEKAVRPGA